MPTCTDCHNSKPHGATANLNKHRDRVACQMCRIPKFGKDVGDEMSRDSGLRAMPRRQDAA